MPEQTNDLVAVGVGNTRLRFGRFEGASLHAPRALAIADLAEAARAIADVAVANTPVVIASVNDNAAGPLESMLADLHVRFVLR
jgi:hypothetical protein